MQTPSTTKNPGSRQYAAAGFGRTLIGGLALLLASASGYGMEWPPPQPVQQRIDQALSALEQLSEDIGQPTSNLADLAFELEFDYDAAVRYVDQEVGFEPYAGVLRGPEGTQIAGSGNSWDKALLLAGLLKSMGAEAQVVAGQITQEDASRLLERTFSARADDSRIRGPDVDRLVSLATAYDARIGERLAAQIEAWEKGEDDVSIEDDTARIAVELNELLDSAGRGLTSSESADPLIEQLASDYAWVRWRIGPGDPWVDVHPAFPGHAAPESTIQEYFDQTIPPEFQHRAALQLFAERGQGSNVERIALMSRFERPIAQLYKNPVEIGMIPLRVGDNENQSFLVPRLNGAVAPGGQAINELGLTASPGDAATSAGQFIATASSKMGDALGGLAGAGSTEDGEDATPRVQGLVLEVEVIQPGGDARTIVRRVFDRRAWPEAQFPADAAFGLVLEFDIGRESGAALRRNALEQHETLIGAMPTMLAVARGALGPDEAQSNPEYRNLDGDVWLDFDLYSDAFVPATTSDRAIYRPGPLIAARRTFSDPVGGTLTVTDILSNPARALVRNEAGDPVIDPLGSLRQGVRETLLESSLAAANGSWSARPPSELVASTSELSRTRSKRDWPAAAVEAAQRDLDAGYVLAVTDDASPHWWRIDPANGETLGMGTYGGQEIVEYIVMVGGAAMSTYFFYKSVESCDEQYADNQQMADCCIVGNLLVTYGNSAAGSATGGLPTGPSAAWLANPWLAGLGYFTASMQIELANNLVTGAVTEGPIEYVCREYVID